jgi:hypothetical protein
VDFLGCGAERGYSEWKGKFGGVRGGIAAILELRKVGIIVL